MAEKYGNIGIVKMGCSTYGGSSNTDQAREVKRGAQVIAALVV
jgi:hypothetical protein